MPYPNINTTLLNIKTCIVFFFCILLINCKGKLASNEFKYISFSKGNFHTLEDLVEKEIKEKRIPVLFFASDKSETCKKIKNFIEKEKVLINTFSEFTLIELSLELSELNKRLKEPWEMYNVFFVPTFIRLNAKLKVISKLSGNDLISKNGRYKEFIGILMNQITKEEIDKTNNAKKLSKFDKRVKNYLYKNRFIQEYANNEYADYKLLEDKYIKDNHVKIIKISELENLTNQEDLSSIKSLSVSIINENNKDLQKALKALKLFKNLECLHLRFIPFFPEEVYLLKKLKGLHISGTYNYSFDGRLKNLKNIEYLNVFDSNISLNENIQYLTDIKHLLVNGVVTKQAFEFIYDLNSLETLRARVREKENLKGIKKLKNLRVLTLNYFHNELNEINDLAYLNLKLKTLGNTNVLENLNRLEILRIYNVENFDKDLVLRNLPALKFIELKNSANLKSIPLDWLKLNELKFFKIDSDLENNFEMPIELKESLEDYVIYKRNNN